MNVNSATSEARSNLSLKNNFKFKKGQDGPTLKRLEAVPLQVMPREYAISKNLASGTRLERLCLLVAISATSNTMTARMNLRYY